MGNKKLISNVLMVAGIILLVLSLAADLIGIGPVPGFGYKQIIGAVVGAIAALAGYVMSRK
jgi:hypothetical protein